MNKYQRRFLLIIIPIFLVGIMVSVWIFYKISGLTLYEAFLIAGVAPLPFMGPPLLYITITTLEDLKKD